MIFKKYYKSCCESNDTFLEFSKFLKTVWNKKQERIIHNIDNSDDLKKMTNNMKDILSFWVSQKRKIIYYGFDFNIDNYRYNDNDIYFKHYNFDKLKYVFLLYRIRDLKYLLRLLKIQKRKLKSDKDEIEDYCLHILYDNIIYINNTNNYINIYKQKFIPTLKTIYENIIY